VLGLREQVHRHPVGVGGAVAQHQDFGRAGDHVDADGAEHAALGGGDIGVAGADDLVDRLNRRGAVGQRADCLRAADGDHARDAGDRGGGQHHLVLHAVRGRHHHDDLKHASHLGGNRVHQHRRWVCGLAARDVDADPVERGDALAQHGAIRLGVAEALQLLLLPFVEHADTIGSGLQRSALSFGQ
jgi:hypothetical protein